MTKRKRKKHGAHLSKGGAYSNGDWPGYRNGTVMVGGKPVPVKSRITLAGPKPKPILRGEKRQGVIDMAMDALRDWRLSPFEHEAACQHGLRSGLCMDGHPWNQADAEAQSIVAEGLRLLGAKRPSHDEGQWQYTVAMENCSWCCSPIDEEDQARGNRFCSVMCAKSANEHRVYETASRYHEVGRSAYVMIKRDEAPALRCQHCDKEFKRFGAQWDSMAKFGRGKFCSVACKDTAARIYQDRTCSECGNVFYPAYDGQRCCSKRCALKSNRKGPNRVCKNCGKGFRSYRVSDPSKGLYCSRACANEGGPTIQIARTCLWCSRPYVARSPKSRCCNPKCTQALVDIRSGTWVPKRISPPVFDYVFKMAA